VCVCVCVIVVQVNEDRPVLKASLVPMAGLADRVVQVLLDLLDGRDFRERLACPEYQDPPAIQASPAALDFKVRRGRQ